MYIQYTLEMLYWNAYHDKQDKLNNSTFIKNQSNFHKNFYGMYWWCGDIKGHAKPLPPK